MNKAQEIRLKRLVERCNNDDSRLLEAKKSQMEEEVRIGIICQNVRQEKAKELFEWVLDLFENPTPYNTLDEVILTIRLCFPNILIGRRKGFTWKMANGEDLKELAKMFNEQEGYEAKYSGGNFFSREILQRERLVIKIKK